MPARALHAGHRHLAAMVQQHITQIFARPPTRGVSLALGAASLHLPLLSGSSNTGWITSGEYSRLCCFCVCVNRGLYELLRKRSRHTNSAMKKFGVVCHANTRFNAACQHFEMLPVITENRCCPNERNDGGHKIDFALRFRPRQTPLLLLCMRTRGTLLSIHWSLLAAAAAC